MILAGDRRTCSCMQYIIILLAEVIYLHILPCISFQCVQPIHLSVIMQIAFLQFGSVTASMTVKIIAMKIIAMVMLTLFLGTDTRQNVYTIDPVNFTVTLISLFSR